LIQKIFWTSKNWSR